MTASKGIRKPSTVSREDQLANAAAARAQLLSWFHKYGLSATANDVWGQLASRVQEFGYTKVQLQTQLDVLVKSGELQSFTRDGKVQKHYAPKEYTPHEAETKQDSPSPAKAPKVKVSATNLVKINVVKATGAVQIVTQGLTIEINVV